MLLMSRSAALENIHEEMEVYTSEISWSDLVDAGLVGGEMAKSRREKWVSY